MQKDGHRSRRCEMVFVLRWIPGGGRSLPRRPNFLPRRRARARLLFRRAERAPENMGPRGNAALPPW